MNRLKPLALLLALATVAVAQSPAPKPGIGAVRTDPVRRDLFYFFLLQNLTKEVDPANKAMPVGGALATFTADRRAEVDRLISAVDKLTDDPPEIRAALMAYRAALEDVEKHAQDAAKLEGEYQAGIEAITQAARERFRVAKENVNEQMDELLLRAVKDSYLIVAFNSSWAADRHINQVQAAAAMVGQRRIDRAEKRIFDEARAAIRRYEAANFPRLKEELAANRRNFEALFAPKLSAVRDQIESASAKVAAARGWKEVDQFDPYPALWASRHVRVEPSATADEFKAASRTVAACLDAEKLIPDRGEFWPIKARFALEAGLKANELARMQAGRTGLLNHPGRGDPDSAAAVAYRAWRRYAEMEKPDFSTRGLVTHQSSVALAAWGARLEAAKRVADYVRTSQKGRLSDVTDPEFWFDFARIAATRPYATDPKRLQPDYKSMLVCLDVAVQLGSKNAAAAKSHPDFDRVFDAAPADVRKELVEILGR